MIYLVVVVDETKGLRSDADDTRRGFGAAATVVGRVAGGLDQKKLLKNLQIFKIVGLT